MARYLKRGMDASAIKAADAKDREAEGKTLLGIYALNGDNLRLCLAPTNRPTAFATEVRTDTVLMILKRETK